MPINLHQAVEAEPFTGDYAATLDALQDRLSALQTAQTVHGMRSVILFEGWEGIGKKEALKKLTASFDPCQIATFCTAIDDNSGGRHWLADFWSKLPSAGHSSIFYHSWYRNLLEHSMDGLGQSDKTLSRACDEVNEFEAQQHDHDTMIIKLFFHCSVELQTERMEARLADPWERHLVRSRDRRSINERAHREESWNRIFAQTDTRWAPWKLIDATDKYGARIAALKAVVEQMERALPKDPPAEPPLIAQPILRSV